MKISRSLITKSLLVSTVPLLTIHNGGALAQGADDSLVLEEITVTARKRTESLMRVPISVTAISGKEMDRVGATTLEQISAGVPGLQIGRSAQTTNIFIRGIGSGSNKSFEQSVGMYIDGIYMPRSRQYSQAFLDLRQIEVLRGPQGILFGKNTIAGAIKIETYTPQAGEDLAGNVSADYEPEQSAYRFTAAVSLPISDNWAVRLAGRYEYNGGYTNNLIFNNKGQQRKNALGRATLAGNIADQIRSTTKISYADMKGEGIDVVVGVYEPSLGAGLPAAATVGAAFYNFISGFSVADGTGSVGKYDSHVGNLRYGEDTEYTKSLVISQKFEIDLEKFTLTSVTGYSDFEFGKLHDTDFGPINLVHNDEGETLQQFSQELRVASSFEGRINFVAGAYYEIQDMFIKTNVFLDGEIGGFAGSSGAFGPFDSLFDGLLFPVVAAQVGCNPATLTPAAACGVALSIARGVPNQIGRAPTFNQDAKTFALFGEVTIDIIDNLRLDVGGRYSYEKKDVIKGLSIFIDDDPTLVVRNPDGSDTGLLDPLTTNLVAGVWGSSFNTFPHNQEIEISENHFDPSVRLSWDFEEDSMLYISYTEGYKSGGINFSPDTANPDGSIGDGTTFSPEQVKSVELGLRSTLMDDRLRVGITIFNSTFKNLQVTSFRGTSFTVGNAAESRSRGAELETRYRASRNLLLGASVGYLDNKFTSFSGAGCTIAQQAVSAVAGEASCTQDLTGEANAFAPKWSGKVFADVYYPINDDYELNARVDLNFKSSHFLNFDLDPTSLQNGYVKVDARISLAQTNEKGWELALYARNLTNKATYSFQFNNPLSAGAFSRWIEEPRVIGIQGRHAF